MGLWIHVHGKFMLESNFCLFNESRFASILSCEILFTPNSCNLSNMIWNHPDICNLSLKIMEKEGKLQCKDFTCQTYAETWNHGDARFTYILITRVHLIRPHWCTDIIRHILTLMQSAQWSVLACNFQIKHQSNYMSNTFIRKSTKKMIATKWDS